MKRNVAIILIILILVGLAVPLIGCGSKSSGVEGMENQVATVQRGNLSIDITAAGNLALSRTEDLAFEIAGTVEEVLVEEGDIIEEGQVLAKLDTSEWEDQLTALEQAVTSKELTLLQKQIDLQTAGDNLDAIGEVAEAQDAIDDAEYDLEIARAMTKLRWAASPAELEYWRNQVTIYEEILAEAQRELREILDGSSTAVTDDVAREVAQKKLRVELAQGQLKDAEDAVEDAKKDLEEAKGKSPLVTAPFAGFITKVNVEGGDEVLKGTVAVQLADPDKFEAEILVSEMDILQVKEGGEARVQVDAMSGLTLPAEVTHISPTATIQSGVVNYKVKVEVASLEEMMQEQQAARQETMEKIAQGELPERLQRAIEEGQITQEQAEEMMKQMQQAQAGQQVQAPTAIPEDFQLREGLTVTVSVILQQKTDVLLVPNAAITTEGRQSYVQVVTAAGTTEKRAITTGITDYVNTEVTEGLSEGEQVVVPQGTTTTTTTPQQQGPPGGMFIPGMGGPPR